MAKRTGRSTDTDSDDLFTWLPAEGPPTPRQAVKAFLKARQRATGVKQTADSLTAEDYLVVAGIHAARYAEYINREFQKDAPELAKKLVLKIYEDYEIIPRNEQESMDFEYPQPDISTEVDAIQQRGYDLERTAENVASLGLEDMDLQVQVAGLHELAERTEKLARDIGLHALAEGKMSQVQLSRLLGVAQMTVHRWAKEYRDQQEQPDQQSGQASEN